MNLNRAKLKIKELKKIAHKDGDGFLGFYFVHGESTSFTGTLENLSMEEGAFVIRKLVDQMQLTPHQLMQIYKGGETIQ